MEAGGLGGPRRLDGCTARTVLPRLGHGSATARPRLGHGSATARPRLGHGSATARPRLGHGSARLRAALPFTHRLMSLVNVLCYRQYMAAWLHGCKLSRCGRLVLGPGSAVASSSRARGAPLGAPPASRPGAGWPARAGWARADPRVLAGARHACTLRRRQTLSCEMSLGDEAESAAERIGLWRLPVTVS